MSGPGRVVLTLVLFAIVVALSPCVEASAEEEMKSSATVVYNHVPGTAGKSLEPQGGFSAVVRFDDRTILFDTGGERTILLRNLKQLEIDPFGLDAIVISHNHWDHVYGLPGLSRMAGGNPPVYVPASAEEGIRQQNPRANLVAVTETVAIAPGVWVVGPLELEFRGIPFAEQAVVLEGRDGLTVLVGCSHPGLVRVVETVKKRFRDKKIALVGGGFHLRSTPEPELEAVAASLRELGVARLAPSHCTGEQATEIFRRTWGQHVLAFELGDTIRF